MTAPIPDSLLGPLLEQAAVGIAVLDAEGRYLYVNQRLAEVNGAPVEEHIGRTIAEVIPHIAPSVEDLHGRVLEAGAPIRDLQLRGTTMGAPESSWLVSYLPVEFDGRSAVGVVLVDTTERDRAAEDARRRVRQHAAVADLGQRALAGASVEELKWAAADTILTQLDADRSGVLEFVEDRSQLVMRAGAGWPKGAMGRVTADLGLGSQAGFTLISSGVTLSADLETEDRFHVSDSMRAVGTRCAISTTIPDADEPFGVLGVFSREPGHFDEDDAGFVRAVANVLGAAVVRERQAGRLRELSGQRGRLVAQTLEASERDQRRIADLLHEDVLQHLLFARQELEDAATDDAALARARDSIERSASTLRSLVSGLHSVTLAHADLAAALESLAGEQASRAGLRADVRVDPAATGAHDRLVVSLVRELLGNVVRHAEASRAHVTVAASGDALELVVADDGRGMAADAFETALAEGKTGLATTRERVEALGGMARVCEGLEGRGSGVEIRIPL